MKRIIGLGVAVVLCLLGDVQAAKKDTTAAEGYKIHVVTDRPEALYSAGIRGQVFRKIQIALFGTASV